MGKKKLTHLSEKGEAHMVDVGEKAVSAREAVAEGFLLMSEETCRILFEEGGPKGDALAVARVAGIQAAKRTAELIPLCHPIQTSYVGIEIERVEHSSAARVVATVRVTERTGVEMEALTGAMAALLTLYDMLKAVQKDLEISGVRLLKKRGGKSGDYNAL